MIHDRLLHYVCLSIVLALTITANGKTPTVVSATIGESQSDAPAFLIDETNISTRKKGNIQLRVTTMDGKARVFEVDEGTCKVAGGMVASGYGRRHVSSPADVERTVAAWLKQVPELAKSWHTEWAKRDPESSRLSVSSRVYTDLEQITLSANGRQDKYRVDIYIGLRTRAQAIQARVRAHFPARYMAPTAQLPVDPYGYRYKNIRTMVFSQDSHYLAINDGGRVNVYSANNGEQLASIYPKASAWDIAFSADGKTLRIATEKVFSTWDWRAEKQLDSWQPERSHRALTLARRDGRVFLEKERVMYLASYPDGKLIRELGQNMTIWDSSPEGYIAYGARDDKGSYYGVLNMLTGEPVLRVNEFGPRSPILAGSKVLLKDSFELVVGDLSTGKTSLWFKSKNRFDNNFAAALNCRRAVTVDNFTIGGLIDVVDSSGKLIRQLGPLGYIGTVAMSPDGTKIVANINSPDIVALWNLEPLSEAAPAP